MSEIKPIVVLDQSDAFSLIRTEMSVLFETGQKDFTLFSQLPFQLLDVDFKVMTLAPESPIEAEAVSLNEMDQLLELLADQYIHSTLTTVEQLTKEYLLSKLKQVRSVNIVNKALQLASQY